ncbi:translation initiation factor IF-2-like [Dipodomys spectabilis]|uniref:translation initiation factor IF-2-like n=1 Tax=Dipodomys spectabilis TaxID=105255 RepID=UPI001C543C45|nr:translation initiation factor IF-2-like [Dipodomys spectabilis]
MNAPGSRSGPGRGGGRAVGRGGNDRRAQVSPQAEFHARGQQLRPARLRPRASGAAATRFRSFRAHSPPPRGWRREGNSGFPLSSVGRQRWALRVRRSGAQRAEPIRETAGDPDADLKRLRVVPARITPGARAAPGSARHRHGLRAPAGGAGARPRGWGPRRLWVSRCPPRPLVYLRACPRRREGGGGGDGFRRLVAKGLGTSAGAGGPGRRLLGGGAEGLGAVNAAGGGEGVGRPTRSAEPPRPPPRVVPHRFSGWDCAAALPPLERLTAIPGRPSRVSIRERAALGCRAPPVVYLHPDGTWGAPCTSVVAATPVPTLGCSLHGRHGGEAANLQIWQLHCFCGFLTAERLQDPPPPPFLATVLT